MLQLITSICISSISGSITTGERKRKKVERTRRKMINGGGNSNSELEEFPATTTTTMLLHSNWNVEEEKGVIPHGSCPTSKCRPLFLLYLLVIVQ